MCNFLPYFKKDDDMGNSLYFMIQKKNSQICQTSFYIYLKPLIQEFFILIYTQSSPMMIYTPKKGQKLITIKIIDITTKQHQLQVSSQLSGYQVKQLIYQKICKQLKIKEMRLTYEGAQLTNNLKISQFNVAVGNMLVFKQQKINLNQVSQIKVHDIQDQIFFQKYQYQWPCGHYIGQAGIVAHIKAVITKGETVIMCPFELENGAKCGFQWDYNMCKKIGVLTAQEKKQFQTALSQNYINQRSKKCPKCNQIFMKQTDSNRVRCPYANCKYGDFCYRCLGPWSDPKSNSFCGSQTCKFAYEYLIVAPWDRVFTLQTKDQNKKTIKIQVKTPHFRSCPNCNMVIENYTACKHTTCSTCNTKFCWVCLSVYKNKWLCGGYGDYCGSVAQVQKYHIKS